MFAPQQTAANHVKRYLLRIVHSNSYIAIPIVAITLATYMQVGEFNLNIPYIGFIFFSTLFLYPLHRLVGLRITNPIEFTKSQRWIVKKPNLARASVIIGLIGTLIFTFFIPVDTLQFLLPLGIISITYSIPLIPTNNGWKRLRDIPGLKIYGISVVVTLTTSSIPLIVLNNIPMADIILLGLQRFLLILAITIPFDIRDVNLDKKWGLKTLPLILGSEKALKLAIYLIYLSVVIAVFQWAYSAIYGLDMLIAIAVSSMWTLFVLQKFKAFNTTLYNAFMIEGSLVFQFAMVTIAAVLHTMM